MYCCFFCLFQYIKEKEYQTESKRDETFGSDLFGTNANLETWSGRQETTEAATRVPGAPSKGGHAPHPHGPLERPPTYFFLLYIYISMDPKTSRSTTKNYFHRRNLLHPRDPILEPSPVLCRSGESTMEGLYIISKASPMSCE